MNDTKQPYPQQSSHEDLTSGRLGLLYGKVELSSSHREWEAAFRRLAAELGQALGGQALAIEHIGSTAVPGLPAKPIIDIAVGLKEGTDVRRVVGTLESQGWIFRGDKGDAGGLVFVFEAKPWHRLAHIHAVPHDGQQWRRYITFRDRLRADPSAREAYARLKHQLAEQFPDDRRSYTAAKDAFVSELLRGDTGATS